MLFKHGQNYFDVKWLDEPIGTFRIDNGIPLTIGPWYERREAARFALYRWDEFEQLNGEDQSAIVAHYRMHNRITAMVEKHQEQRLRLKGI